MKVTNGTRHGRPPKLYRAAELKIEKDVPLPEEYRLVTIRQTLESLEVGDSVVLPLGENAAGLSAFSYIGKGKYAKRKVTPKSTRVWRIA